MQRLVFVLGLFLTTTLSEAQHRVFVFSDINIDAGDPDDRQSLIHFFWYANELQIEGFVPERWSAKSLEASAMVLRRYRKDFKKYSFRKSNYPNPKVLNEVIAKNKLEAERLFVQAAVKTESPLYVLVWGTMELFASIIDKNPELASNIRLITIGTGLMLENDIKSMPASWKKTAPCKQLNWNGFGRNEVYNDPRFKDMWWLEMNWTYNGMFAGEEPKQMFEKLSKFGAMGLHVKEVVKNEPWARYFRVGDTPSVLYLIDHSHDADNPKSSSWAGKFNQPFLNERKNYFCDANGPVAWDYENPCKTWQNHLNMKENAAGTLEERREEMYQALLDKLQKLYKKD